MKVTITKEIGELWATPEEFAAMSDAEIVEMFQEDLSEILDGATWEITR